MGLFDRTTELVSSAAEAKAREYEAKAHQLQCQLKPADSWVERAGGSQIRDRFTDRKAKRKQLREYHKIRVDGGIVATLLEMRGLMVFGVGGEWKATDDDVEQTLNEAFADLNGLTLDIGTDALFYGYSLGELRATEDGEDFGDVTLIQPWTTVPELGNGVDITRWEQKIKSSTGQSRSQTFDADEVLHFNVMKASGRDPVGMSMLGRAMDEAKAYRDNQRAIKNATELHGFPKWHIKLGRDDGAVIDDNELRRARPKFDNINELTKWVTGQDVDIETISPDGFDFEAITEHDLSKLAIAFMLPVELTQISGGDGLGTGFPARLRERMFLLSAYAQQNQLAGQLVRQVAHPILEEFEGMSTEQVENADVRYEFDEPITDLDDLDTKVGAIGDDMTVNERRAMFDLPPVEDDEIGEQFDAPGETDSGAGGGFFNQAQPDQQLQGQADEFWWEDHLATIEDLVWDEDPTHELFGFSEGGTPEFVTDMMRQAILSGGPIFSDIESIPNGQLQSFRVFMLRQLTDDGWTISEMRDEIVDRFGVDPADAETMARSTTQNMVSKAAEQGYRDRDDFDDLRFTWPSINDGRDSDVCKDIVAQVPNEGLPMDELQETVHDVAERHDLDPRGWTPHPNCRRRPIRVT
jgi:hypothetical protein